MSVFNQFLKRILSLFVFVGCSISIGFGQIDADTHAIRHESMRQGINTLSAGTVGDWRKAYSGNQKMEIQTGQYLIYNRALPKNPFITNNFWARASHRITWNKRWNLQNEAWQYSFYANETRIAQFLSQLRYHILDHNRYQFFVQGAGGLVNDKRLNNNNSGVKGEVQTEFYGTSRDSSLTTRIISKSSVSQISPRNNQKFYGQASISKDFQGGGLLAFMGGYLQTKVEDYLGEDIQTIKSDTFFSKVQLRIPLGKAWILSSDNELQTPNRSFLYRNKESGKESRNVRYFQDEYQSNTSLKVRKKRYQAQIAFESRLRNRTYDIINRLVRSDPRYFLELQEYNQKLSTERIKDIREQFSTWTAEGRLRIHSQHFLRFNYVAQLLRVDTRSDQNNQDRDELLYAGEIAHDWTMAFGFRMINKFSASYRHLIFIEASQSSENYIDRILRWEPSLRWANQWFSWNGQLGIWATYQVRDFESQEDKNRSNRVLIFNHQVDIKIANRWRILAEALRRENRLSQFNWGRFSESPIDTVTIYDLAARSQYLSSSAFDGQWSIQTGYRAFWQVRKSKASLTDPAVGAKLIFLKSYFVQQGPQVKFLYQKNERIRVQAEIWLQWSSQYYRYNRSEKVFLGNNYSPEQLSVTDRRFLPFFTLQGTWFFSRRKAS